MASLFETLQARFSSARHKDADSELPADMSTMSLVGGGLIAGDALAALSIALYGLLKTVL